MQSNDGMSADSPEPTSFIQDVAERAGLDHETATRVVHATLAVLGRRLPRVDAEAVAMRLPPELGAALLDQPYEGECGPDGFLEKAPVSDARGPLAVLRLLAERLDEQARAHLRIVNLRRLLS